MAAKKTGGKSATTPPKQNVNPFAGKAGKGNTAKGSKLGGKKK